MHAVCRSIALIAVLFHPVGYVQEISEEARQRMEQVLVKTFETTSALKTDTPVARLKAVRTEAYEYGIAHGVYEEMNIILSELEHYDTHLSQIADFSKFIVNNNILLPVVLQTDELYEYISDTESRRIDSSLQIIKGARLVEFPPTWRDYIILNPESPDPLDPLFLPRNDEESVMFQAGFKSGYTEGIHVAHKTFDIQFSTMELDITGMYTFLALNAIDAVSLPSLNIETKSVVTMKNGKVLNLNDEVYQIQTDGDFTSVTKWKAIFLNKSKR